MARTQDVIVKKLPELLQNLPDQGFLQLDLTEEQKECFEKMRESNFLLSQALEAKFTGQDGIFEQVLENQGIDPLKREAIRKIIKEYEILWEIIQLAEPYLKKFYSETAALLYQELQDQSSSLNRFRYRILSKMLKEKYKFLSPEDLFIAIVKEEQYRIFMDSLGLNNTEFSVNKIREILTSFKICIFPGKNEILSPYKYKARVDKVVDYVKINQLNYGWKEMIFFVCFHYLECLQNPYSSDGDAICNSDFEELSD
ncbi:hypothetical protein [Planktothrix sp. FACHB-1365]|uniref:hypothetical protein n=1 Tax=Planktothrix sp. FACHB-1365 TaxID=2692855 RepID=UPI0016897DC4|nr:hypothetical protein [Planktothrix sp. FACHB-1365]MBD2480607.1 hypothetical protein [Planktothrix sp. FACHB-1365]